MASRRIKLIASATVVAVGLGGYFFDSVFAVQGRGTLAQAPLNVTTQIPPAFMMAVDDSGSMNLETLFATRDGALYWGGTGAAASFYDSAGINRDDQSDDQGNQFHRVFAFNDDPRRRSAFVPPIDNFGMARSHEFNPGYYNPGASYPPWQKALAPHWANASPTAAQTEPRSFANAKTSPVFNLTVDMEDVLPASTEPADGNPAEPYDFRPGMVIPAGTVYKDSACNGVNNRTTFGASTANQTVTNFCQMWVRYFPATYFLTTPTSPDGNTAGTLIAAAPGGKPNLYKYEIKPANYPGGAAGTAYTTAIQSFANWFQYYRNRRLATVAAMTHALSGINNMRVGYFPINSYATAVPAMQELSTPAGRTALYDQITNLSYPPVGAQGTPNREAVARMGQQFNSRAGTSAPIVRACQINAGMLFTDGYSNDGGSASPANGDGGMGPPFADAHANTMADIAANYYNMRMRTDLPAGLVRIPAGCPNAKLDCRRDLHMRFYGITLGALANIYGRAPYINAPATPNVDEAYDAAFASPPAWAAAGNDNPEAVDEIWHATINARGEFINATSPDKVTAAMRRILASVSRGASPAGSIAVTGARIGPGSFAVTPFYEARNEGTDWYSTLTAGAVTTTPGTGAAVFTDAWEASELLPAAPVRTQIWFGDSTTARSFTSTNVGTLDNLCNNPQVGMSVCSGTQLAALGGATSPITLDQAIAYLKGDQSMEVARSVTGKLRFRTTRLGDIVNSMPEVSSPRDDYGFRTLPAPYGAAYGTYMATKASSRRAMVYAGANDGMLHGFDGRTDASGGIERFGYIPQGVLGHLGNLLLPYVAADGNDQKFQHRYYVDGPIVVSDVYDATASAWKTALVGTTGAGARGAFALDVSSVSGTSGSFSASDRLWDINELNTSLPIAVRNNIGFVLGKPVIVPIKTGNSTGPVKWRAIFGNGYDSASGKAVLFLVDMADGTPNVTMVEAVESATGVPPGANGLGNIIAVDRWSPAADGTLTSRARDGFADTVYAADQKGAIWKFDLRNATPAAQSVPLFTTLKYTTGPETGTRQPILGGLTAAAAPGGGVLVYFGTGSFSFNDDGLDTTQQSLYAVLDNNSGTTSTRAGLLQQTVGTTTAGLRTTSSNAATTISGWYLDLPVGERFVAYPRIENGVVFMPTYAPAVAGECGTNGKNWLYGLSALSGGAGLSNVRVGTPTGTSPGAGTGAVELVTGGSAPVKEVAVLTSPRISPLGPTATPAELAAALGAQCSMVVQVAGAPPLYLPRACGRQSWRQIQ